MIYLVTGQPRLFESTLYEVISVEKSLELLSFLPIIEVDTETTGRDPIICKILTLQLGCCDFQVVIDCSTINILHYKSLLESDKLLLFWNAKFDLCFLYKHGIVPLNVYDGFLAEKLLYLGYPPGIHSLSLLSAAEEYLGEYLDKSIRGEIIWRGLSPEVIVYAANDVKWLGRIRDKQLIKLTSEGLLKAISIENEFVKCLAYIEFCGVKLDVERWKSKMKKDQLALSTALEQLTEYVVTNFSENKNFCRVNLQGDLFTGFNTKALCIINWGSPKQVIPLLELLGFNLKIFDKETKGFKKSTDAKVIEPQVGINDEFLKVYLEYKTAQKLCSTYGQNFLNIINPIDNRIHTQFFQLQDTGRLSSGGGKNSDLAILKQLPIKECTNVNLQNLPSDEETRACFIADVSNSWISADYKGQESFLMASIANDKAMLEELNHGSGDLHSLTAKMVFKHIPKEVDVRDIKKLFHSERNQAKGYEFAFNYGGTDITICKNFGLTPERSKEIYDNYKQGFNGLANYQSFRRKEVMNLGYILLSPLTGHKAYVYDYAELKETQDKFCSEFWDEYKRHKSAQDGHPMLKEVSNYFKRKSASEKQSINYPIQGAGALCFKIASIRLFNWILDNNYFNIIKYVIPVHDEINLECPTPIAQEVAEVLKDCMVEAGKIFCDKALLDTDYIISDHWVH